MSLTGFDIGQAQAATRAVLDRLLASTGLDFHDWIVLNTLHTRPASREELMRSAGQALRIGPGTVRPALTKLLELNLVAEEEELTLTDAGRTRFDQIQSGINDVATRLYGGFPAADLETAKRVLAEVTVRAKAELAS